MNKPNKPVLFFRALLDGKTLDVKYNMNGTLQEYSIRLFYTDEPVDTIVKDSVAASTQVFFRAKGNNELIWLPFFDDIDTMLDMAEQQSDEFYTMLIAGNVLAAAKRARISK